MRVGTGSPPTSPRDYSEFYSKRRDSDTQRALPGDALPGSGLAARRELPLRVLRRSARYGGQCRAPRPERGAQLYRPASAEPGAAAERAAPHAGQERRAARCRGGESREGTAGAGRSGPCRRRAWGGSPGPPPHPGDGTAPRRFLGSRARVLPRERRPLRGGWSARAPRGSDRRATGPSPPPRRERSAAARGGGGEDDFMPPERREFRSSSCRRRRRDVGVK